MSKQQKYHATDRMNDLISRNFSLLMVMSRFGLSLGFGDKHVKEVCDAQQVDYRTFLAVANFIADDDYVYDEVEGAFSVAALMEYLKRAHNYFLDFDLPAIRRKLIDAIDYSGNSELAALIMKFYDEYVKEVRRHMEYENKAVFTYVDGLLEGKLSESYDIDTFAQHHNEIATKLTELKNIIIKYYPGKENNNRLNAVLFDIFNCEEDLVSHCRVEDLLFVPAVKQIEQRLQKEARHFVPRTRNAAPEAEQETISQREKEIITCVVKGMTNKAIADKLFISVHTVMTHRRNIARKLQIHSPAGLTIYAIVNKLVEIQDIKGTAL
ncbi:MAG: LuxR C-terminal-related transcriptional regulator [Prevotellaceae bacterium]|jgi:regulator of cell morphogenesis and NO signaling|nr:LuxR C-terminal-related transcriptional regulator [Prevotellaceae bacterium]